jgi:hypothetical protein
MEDMVAGKRLLSILSSAETIDNPIPHFDVDFPREFRTRSFSCL